MYHAQTATYHDSRLSSTPARHSVGVVDPTADDDDAAAAWLGHNDDVRTDMVPAGAMLSRPV